MRETPVGEGRGGRADDDTEPLPISRGVPSPASEPSSNEPAPSAATPWWQEFSEARIPRRRSPWRRPAASVAAAAVALAAAATGCLLWLKPADSASPTPTSTQESADVAEHERLRSLLPTGYNDHACQPQPPQPNTVAQLACGPSEEPGGPASATFLLARPDADIHALLESALDEGADVVTCPNNIQSPGPWRRNADPGHVAGTLVCAQRSGQATVAWTTDADHLVSVTNGHGPALPELYIWWTTHS